MYNIPEELKQLITKYPNDEFLNKLIENFNIFNDLYKIAGTFHYGCSSYLFEGVEYKYSERMYEKQKLLFEKAKNIKSVLEVGVYMGHSLFIMLLANPDLQIDAIDCDYEITLKCIDFLKSKFNVNINFYNGNSLDYLHKLNKQYDLIHLDGDHRIQILYQELAICFDSLIKNDTIFIIDDYECFIEEISQILRSNSIQEYIIPDCVYKNIYFKLQYNKPKSILNNLKLDCLIDTFFENKIYNNKTNLCDIMKRNGSDKALCKHNYTTFYNEILKNFKEESLNVFELGLGTNNPYIESSMGIHGIPCASIYGWKDFLKNSNIYGADIDKNILIYNYDIKTYYCNQLSSLDILKMYFNKDLFDISFDFIVEDGLHTFDANMNFLQNSLWKLKKGGIYIIEDITIEYFDKFKLILKDIQIRYNLNYINILNIPNDMNSYDNNILIIQK